MVTIGLFLELFICHFILQHFIASAVGLFLLPKSLQPSLVMNLLPALHRVPAVRVFCFELQFDIFRYNFWPWCKQIQKTTLEVQQ